MDIKQDPGSQAAESQQQTRPASHIHRPLCMKVGDHIVQPCKNHSHGQYAHKQAMPARRVGWVEAGEEESAAGQVLSCFADEE